MTLQTYCLHHLPAIDRKEYLLSHFDTSGWHWVTEYLPTDDFIATHPRAYSEHAANGLGFLNAAELSLYYKHKLVMEMVHRDQHFAFIVEDDLAAPAFDLPVVLEFFVQVMQESNVDLTFVGSFGNYDLDFTQPTLVSNEQTRTRCAHAYLVHPRCAGVLSEFLRNVRAPLDWQLDYAIRELGLKSCWSYPHLYQRTEKGAIPSLLRQ